MRALLHFRNLDSTADMNQQLSGFIKRGIVWGGEVLPVPGQLKVDVTPFKLMGVDGLVVLDESQVARLDVVAGRTNVIVLYSKYMPNTDAIVEFQVLDQSAYMSHLEKEYMTVYSTVTLSAGATEVILSDISYQTREEITPLGRSSFRGHIESTADAVLANARPGDFYMVTSGAGDIPAILSFNGTSYVNITDSVVVASLLNAHRNNLFSNERHMSDAQADAAQGSAGSPSATNRFVTEQDLRLPTQDENDALQGLPSTPAPSAANPFVTSSFYIAQPTEISLPAGAATNIHLMPAQGPFFVGTGGVATVKNFFKFYHVDTGGEPREFTDSVNGLPVTVFRIYKDSGLTQELNPAAELSVLNSGGFWNGSLYITYNGTLAHNPSRLLFGKQQTLKNLDKGMFVKPTPSSAQTSQEAIAKFQEISGYLFDEVVSVPETNKELYKSVMDLTRFLETGMQTSRVIDPVMFPKLRETSFATDFVADYSDLVVQAGNLPYNKVQSATFDSAYTAFDPALNAGNTDPDYLAIINYTVTVPEIANIKAGHLFVDQIGKRYRILAVKPSGSLLIYTAGQAVADFTVGGANVGAVFADSNPRRVEIANDFQAYKDVESFLFEGIEETKQSEDLPLGGIAVGTYASITTLPTTVLPNMGSATGVHRGRKIWNVLPKIQGQKVDQRLALIGSWVTDSNIPNQIFAKVSDSAAVEYTGKVKQLTLWVDKNADLAGVNVMFFVDGVATGAPVSLALAAYPHKDLLLDGAKKFPVSITVPQLGSYVHTVRAEFSGPAGVTLPVYGMEVDTNSSGQIELQKGSVHSHLDWTSVSTPYYHTPNTSTHTSSKKILYYVDAGNQAVTVAEVKAKESYDDQLTAIIPQGAAAFSNPVLGPTAKIGDVIMFAKTNNADLHATDVDFKRIINKNFNDLEMTLESANTLPNGLNGFDSLIQHKFTIPVDAAGTPKVQAIGSEDTASAEYARFKLADLALGNELDLGNINPFAEDRATVFADGSSSISVRGCQKTTTDLSGYTEGVQFVSGSSEMHMHLWGTRADVVFSGTQGPTSVQITIDGNYTYTLNLKGTGVEKHTLFYNADLCFHNVTIKNASNAPSVVVSEWIWFDLKAPAVNGVPLFETVVRGTSGINKLFNNVHTTLDVLPILGSRYVDFSKAMQVTSLGISGTKDWNYQVDMTLNKHHGYVLHTDRTDATVSLKLHYQVVATEVYVYYKDSTGMHRVLPDGSGVANLSGNVLTITSPGGEFSIYGIAVVQDGVIQNRHIDDKVSSHLKFSSMKDLRTYVSVNPNHVGSVQGEGTASTVEVESDDSMSAAIEPANGYEAVIFDNFNVFPNLPSSTIDATITNAAYNPQTKTYRMRCDKTKTITISGGTNFTLSSAPSFELKAGDVVVQAGLVYKIQSMTTPTQGVLATNAPSVVGQPCMVSQAVWTKDLTARGDSTQETRPMDIFPNTSIHDAIVYFEDSLALGDVTFDKSKASRLAFVGSSQGLQGVSGTANANSYGTLAKRPTAAGTQESYNFPVATDNQRLFVGFFCNPDNTDVVDGANLLRYDVSFYSEQYDMQGGDLHSAFAMSDGSTTPKNCTLSVVGGKTVLTLTNWSLSQGVGAGQVVGDADITIDGTEVEQLVVGTTPATDVCWSPVVGRPDQIEFTHNLSTLSPAVRIKVKKRFGTKDMSPINRTILANEMGILVGTPAMVAAGIASYSSLQAAVTASPTDGVITVMNGTSITENVTVNKRVYIQGKGYGSHLNGTLTVAVGSDYSTIKGLRFGSGSVASSGCQITECFFTTAPTDTGVANSIQGVEV